MKLPVRILYLDDEEQNLLSFKALFRRDYEVFTTASPAEAVSLLNAHDIHVIFSDQKMPELSGVEFFELIKPDFPDPIRVLLTGYADIEAVIDAINKGQVYRYLTKPWIENELRITIEDAFEMFESRRQVKVKNEALEKAYDELEKFVYSASHDLRAPLVSIRGIIKLARTDNDPERYSEYLNMMDSSVVKLDTFVTNIIHYYQNNKFDTSNAEVDIKLLIRDSLEQFAHYEGANKIRFETTVEGEAVWMSDELRVKAILSNLISNAIKFRDDKSADSRITITALISPAKAVLRVADNGLGISESDLPRIFDLFYKSVGKNIGSGLGLYIVKEAVDKLGGKIAVTSDQINGTIFQVEIPNRS